MTHQDLVGQKIDFVYDDETYQVDVLDSTSLRWTRTVGEVVGSTDVEQYVWSRIDEEHWLITWVEATGLGLSSVIDVGRNTLITHANNGREVFVNSGRVRWPT